MLLAALTTVMVAAGCSSSPVDPDTGTLTGALSLSAVRTTPIADPSDPARITGVLVEATVVNTARFPVTRAFRMTWALREDGKTFATASTVFTRGLDRGASEKVLLRLTFPSRASMAGVTDAVFYDLLDG